MFFNFLKSKPSLKELIPEGSVDIHSHILPGIDDGAKNIEESVKLISEMKKIGFSKIIGTPHSYPGLYDNTNEDIESSYRSMCSTLPKEIEINYASEYMIDISLIKKIKSQTILCIKDNYVLIELPFIDIPINTYEIIFEIITNDYIPILAHPERYLFLFNNKLEEVFKLKKIGCKFQMNLLSTTGYYGKEVLKNCNFLFKYNLIDFIGSDVHNINHLQYFDKTIKIKEIKKLENSIQNNLIFS